MSNHICNGCNYLNKSRNTCSNNNKNQNNCNQMRRPKTEMPLRYYGEIVEDEKEHGSWW